MAIGITPKAKWSYVPLRDRKLPEDQRSVFHLRRLSHPERAKMRDASGEVIGDRYVLRIGQANGECLFACLEGWDNFKDENGNAIPFERVTKPRLVFGVLRRGPTDDTLEWLDHELFDEIAGAIRDGQQVTEGDAKNFSSQPPSPTAAAPTDAGTAGAAAASAAVATTGPS